MFSKALRKTTTLYKNSANTFASSGAGNLYTWGLIPMGLGRQVTNLTPKVETPYQVPFFQNNVTHVSMGPRMTAIIDDTGKLYTCGYDAHGSLGHGIRIEGLIKPKLVDYFTNNNFKVVDVSCGTNHMVALTDKGDVYSWGYGGSKNFIKEFFDPTPGILGINSNVDRFSPAPIETLQDVPPIQSIVAGDEFSAVLDKNSDIYNWGRGRFGVHGDGHGTDVIVPTVNEVIREMRERDGLKVTKIISRGKSTLALFDNGSLWGWGENNNGQLGVGHIVGIEQLDIEKHVPEKVKRLEGTRVIDFDLGETTGIAVTEDNKVYYWGLRLMFRPWELELPTNARVKKVAAAKDSVAVLTENNEIFTKLDFAHGVKENLEYQVGILTDKAFNGGEILTIGGGYGNKYAIVKN